MYLRNKTCASAYTITPKAHMPAMTPKPNKYFGLSSAGKRYAPAKQLVIRRFEKFEGNISKNTTCVTESGNEAYCKAVSKLH